MLEDFLKENYTNQKMLDRQKRIASLTLLVAQIKKHSIDVNDDKQRVIINNIIYKTTWMRIYNGFEYRDNYRYDKQSKELAFDKHLIKVVDGDYEAEDAIGRNFMRDHLQLFEMLIQTEKSLCNLYEMYKNEVEILFMRQCPDYNLSVFEEKEIINRDKKLITKMDKYNPYYANTIANYLNKLNDTNISIVDLTNQFVKDMEFIKENYFANNYEEYKRFIMDTSSILSIYHPSGFDFGTFVLAAIMPDYSQDIKSIFHPGDLIFQEYENKKRGDL